MSFNSKEELAAMDAESKEQMQEAFRTNPTRSQILDILTDDIQIAPEKKEQKENVSIRMNVSLRKDLQKLAKKSGFDGLSPFVVAVLEQVIGKSTK